MAALFLLIGSAICLLINFLASKEYALHILDMPSPGDSFFAAMLVLAEVILEYARRRPEYRPMILGEEESPENLRAIFAPLIVRLMLVGAWVLDIYTTTAALSGWNPMLSPMENIMAMFDEGPEEYLRTFILIIGGAFIAVGPEVALLTLFEEGVGFRAMGIFGLFLKLFHGAWLGLQQIPENARLVAFGKKKPSSPNPGPFLVLMALFGVITLFGAHMFNIYTTYTAASRIMHPFIAGGLEFLGLALLLTGFQGLLWGPERQKAPIGWIVFSLLVDFATAFWFIAGRWFTGRQDFLAILISIFLAVLVISPEMITAFFIRALEKWSRSQITYGIAAIGDYIGWAIYHVRSAYEENEPSSRRAEPVGQRPVQRSLMGGLMRGSPQDE